jgi:hypothetical protein
MAGPSSIVCIAGALSPGPHCQCGQVPVSARAVALESFVTSSTISVGNEQLGSSALDCHVIENGGAKQYSVHLEVVCRSSTFFFDVAAGRSQSAEKTLTNSLPSDSDGDDMQLKTQDGTIVRIGKVTSTMTELKADQHDPGHLGAAAAAFLQESSGR